MTQATAVIFCSLCAMISASQLQRKDLAILQLQAATSFGRDLMHRSSPSFSLDSNLEPLNTWESPVHIVLDICRIGVISGDARSALREIRRACDRALTTATQFRLGMRPLASIQLVGTGAPDQAGQLADMVNTCGASF